MEKLLEKISSYEILNNLIPGSLFGILLPFFVPVVYPGWSSLEKLIIAYIAGIIISRFGSLVITPLFLKCKFITHSLYENYIVASERDNKIDIFNSTSNMYRSLLSAFILLGVSCVLYRIQVYFAIPQSIFIFSGLLTLIILMAYAYKKQTQFVSKRVDHHTKNDPNLTPTHTNANAQV